MDSQQVESARRARTIYLVFFLINVLAGIALRVTPNTALLQIPIGIVFAVGLSIVTWRFCRAIGIGAAWSAINAVLSPIIALLQLVVLLRIYAKRTRTGLTFLMGERAPSRT